MAKELQREVEKETGGMKRQRVEPGTLVAHVLAVAAAVMVLYWCIHFRGGLALRATDKSLIFNVHPVLMVIGLIIMGGEAIMSYRSLPLSKESKKMIHLVLHGFALLLGVVGVYAVFKFHNESGIPNLYSLHSWIGLTTIILYGIQWILGFIIFFFPGAVMSTRRSIIPWHVVFGLFIFILAIGSAELGLLEKLTFLERTGFNKYGTEALLVNFTGIILILLGAAVIISTLGPFNTEDPSKYTAV